MTPDSRFELESGKESFKGRDLAAEVEQLADNPELQARLNEVLEALRAYEQGNREARPPHEQGSREAPARLMEAVSQLWQHQPQEPATLAQMQQFLSALQKELAAHPKSEALIAQLRGMQDAQLMRPTPLKQAVTLGLGELGQQLAVHQSAKQANGAPLAPLQVQSLLTQPQTDSQLLSLMTTPALHGEQLSELTSLAQLRQSQPQLPVTAGTMSRPMPGMGGHEFSPLTLDKQSSLWAEQLLGPLTDRLRVQSQLGVKQATLRLDPPELGKLDLQVRTEGDRVFIQISATNPAVRDQLMQLSDRLRQDVLSDNAYSQVDVEVGQHGEQAGDQQAGDNSPQMAQAIEGHDEQAQHSSANATSDYHLDTYV